jgi:hypothetical protein
MAATVSYSPPKLGSCRRCYLPKPATSLQIVDWGGESYQLALCDDHADMLQTAMFSWTRVGEIIVPAQVHAPVATVSPAAAPAARQGPPVRIPVPPPPTTVEVVDPPQEPAWLESVPENVRELARSAPGMCNWRLTAKARQRADEAGVDLLAVLLAAEAPEDTRPSGKDPSACLHTRDGVTAIVNVQTKVVLTMFRKEEHFRGSQAS